MEHYGGQLIEIIVLAPDKLFFIRTGANTIISINWPP